MEAGNYDIKRGTHRFYWLGAWYVLALSVIAAVAITGQVLIQSHLRSQLVDSHVINVAGKQRMLSQQITKSVLLLRIEQRPAERQRIVDNLRQSFTLWKTSHEGLMHGNDSLHLSGENSGTISKLFEDTRDAFQEMSSSVSAILTQADVAVEREGALEPYIGNILLHEPRFLAGMERIAAQYESEAKEKVSSLRLIEYTILGISLLVIALEIIFIFRPAAHRVNDTISKLIASEKNARKLAREIGALYSSLEKTYEQMAILNQPVDNPRLIAKADHGGNITYVSETFAELTGHVLRDTTRICDLFPEMKDPDDWMDTLVDVASTGRSWQGEIKFRNKKDKDCWFDTIVTPVYRDGDEMVELVVLGADISSRKIAEQSMNQKNRAEIEKKINQQKFRSVLILEGQEEERKRIAMDIHDGIGQMLTSLKYQIGSIDLKRGTEAEQKISEIDQLIKEIIKEVRKVTFNLKPTVLVDYGLQAGLNVFIQEIGKLTDIAVQYKTTGSIPRLPQKVENNIFRIIQEAVNNAIKYSGAQKITVSLKQAGGEMVLTVQDDGTGFDPKIAEGRSSNLESGRGFFNMYERTEYVNGNLEIQSRPGMGSTIRLTVPLSSAVITE